MLKPGEEWSFNATVGERSEKEGYKVAHVITAGEMVDGLAGGTCQISTTLFGAAFFAGLDIVKTINHSRPSAYTPLGFDATVVWPNTDLKLKNPYEFPVVIHYRVANGEALVEILGKPRPYDKIVFERKILESTPYSTEERLDDEMPQDADVDRPGRVQRLQARAVPPVLQGRQAGQEQQVDGRVQAGHRVRAPRHQHRSRRQAARRQAGRPAPGAQGRQLLDGAVAHRSAHGTAVQGRATRRARGDSAACRERGGGKAPLYDP